MMAGVAMAAGVVILSSLVWLLRLLNDWRFTRGLGPRLPPGSMGWPVLGEMLDFLWCFKLKKRPDDFIAKRRKMYGDTGIYKTHLFGHPAIITCSPEVNKRVLTNSHNDGSFSSGWPFFELIGSSAVTIANGLLHKKLRRHLFELFSSPKSRDFHLSSAQPVIISALEGWVMKQKIVAHKETRFMTFRNICDILVSFKSEELLETMETLYTGVMGGIRSMPIRLPGTAFYHALKGTSFPRIGRSLCGFAQIILILNTSEIHWNSTQTDGMNRSQEREHTRYSAQVPDYVLAAASQGFK